MLERASKRKGASASEGAGGSDNAEVAPKPKPARRLSTTEQDTQEEAARAEIVAKTQIKLLTQPGVLLRGNTLSVRGSVSVEERRCAWAKVDIYLDSGSAEKSWLGVLVTDENGEFEGALVVPPNTGVGDYVLSASPTLPASCR